MTDWITENRVMSSWLELGRLTELLLPFQFFGGKMSHQRVFHLFQIFSNIDQEQESQDYRRQRC